MRAKTESTDFPKVHPGQLQQIIAQLDEGVVLMDAQGTIAWANRSALTLHGVTDVTGLGGTVDGYCKAFRLRDGDHRALPSSRYPMRRAIAGEVLRNVVVEVAAAAGDKVRRVHEVRSLALTSAVGEADGLALIIRNGTARDEGAGHAAAVHPALAKIDGTAFRKAEDGFQTVLDLAPVPMLIVSRKDLRVSQVNDAFVSTTGYVTADVMACEASTLPLWADPGAFAAMHAIFEEHGHLRRFQIGLRTGQGMQTDCVASAEWVVLRGEECALYVLQDNTERQRNEAELIAAIGAVMPDASWFGRRVVEKLAQIRQAPRPPETAGELADLTPRERTILGLMSQGGSDADIAAVLNISRHTVRNHAAALYAKIGVHRRGAAIVWARERGVVG